MKCSGLGIQICWVEERREKS